MTSKEAAGFNPGVMRPHKIGASESASCSDAPAAFVTAMRRKSFEAMECPIARSLERVGEWWSMLILRDAINGVTRFDAFEASLKIAPNMLTRRLRTLVEDGLLERRLYKERPKRYEYVLTDRGRDFFPVILALLDYGNRHFAPEGEALQIVDLDTGRTLDPVLVDRATGEPLAGKRLKLAPGPAASAAMCERYAEKHEASAPAPRRVKR
ncbi:acyl dehydratase [Methylocella silvestris]|uniref:Acyl dehydratase n=2 Tax=Methylocella silvestris TaxID=199596 RepID=A0A2J7THH9_METSI|nr:acyl dehydratase [Methylocella silvestris]